MLDASFKHGPHMQHILMIANLIMAVATESIYNTEIISMGIFSIAWWINDIKTF